MAGDPNWASVSLLLHADGPNGSTGLRDGSPTPHTITTSGACSLSTARAKFGGASLGLTGGYALLDGNAAFSLGTGDFTIEGWLYRTATGQMNITSFNPASTSGLYPELYVNASNVLAYYTNSAERITGTTNVAINTWYHFALSRVAGVTRLFLNGNQEGSSYADANNYIVGASRPTIGAGGSSQTTPLLGNIDEFRITKGVGRYSANFTPPTAPYPDGLGQVSGNVTDSAAHALARLVRAYRRDSGVLVKEVFSDAGDANFVNNALLLPFYGSDGDKNATDKSYVQNKPTFNGSSKLSSAIRQFGSTALFLPGDGLSYLSVPNQPVFSPGAAGSGGVDFTAEAWIYPTAVAIGTIHIIVAKRPNGTSCDWSFQINDTTLAALGWTSAGATAFGTITGGTIVANAWQHVALTRSGSTWNLFMNGVLVGSGPETAPLGIANDVLYIGRDASRSANSYDRDFKGYIEGLRLTYGLARYTANFTPPANRLPEKPADTLGNYSFYTPTLDELTVIALDSATTTPINNDVVQRVIPT